MSKIESDPTIAVAYRCSHCGSFVRERIPARMMEDFRSAVMAGTIRCGGAPYVKSICDEFRAIAEKCKSDPIPTYMEAFHGVAMIGLAVHLKHGLPEDTAEALRPLTEHIRVSGNRMGRGDRAEWWDMYVHESLQGLEGLAKAIAVDELIVLRARLGGRVDEVPDTVEVDEEIAAWARMVMEATNDPDRTRTHLERWAKGC